MFTFVQLLFNLQILGAVENLIFIIKPTVALRAKETKTDVPLIPCIDCYHYIIYTLDFS